MSLQWRKAFPIHIKMIQMVQIIDNDKNDGPYKGDGVSMEGGGV